MTDEGLDLCEVCGGRGGDSEGTLTIAHDHGAFNSVEIRICKVCIAQLTMTLVRVYQASAALDRVEVAAMKKLFGMEGDE